MAEHVVAEDPEPRKPLALVSPVETRRRTAVCRTQEYLNLKGADPDWPKPIYRNGRRFYVESDVDAYIEKLIERRDSGSGTHGMPDQLAAARGYRKDAERDARLNLRRAPA